MRSTLTVPRPAPQVGALRPLQGGAPPHLEPTTLTPRLFPSSVSPDGATRCLLTTAFPAPWTRPVPE